jgi:hypothetical protein
VCHFCSFDRDAFCEPVLLIEFYADGKPPRTMGRAIHHFGLRPIVQQRVADDDPFADRLDTSDRLFRVGGK